MSWRTGKDFSLPKYSGFPLNQFTLNGDVGKFVAVQVNEKRLQKK